MSMSYIEVMNEYYYISSQSDTLFGGKNKIDSEEFANEDVFHKKIYTRKEHSSRLLIFIK
jgi:hypothetical protein